MVDAAGGGAGAAAGDGGDGGRRGALRAGRHPREDPGQGPAGAAADGRRRPQLRRDALVHAARRQRPHRGVARVPGRRDRRGVLPRGRRHPVGRDLRVQGSRGRHRPGDPGCAQARRRHLPGGRRPGPLRALLARDAGGRGAGCACARRQAAGRHQRRPGRPGRVPVRRDGWRQPGHPGRAGGSAGRRQHHRDRLPALRGAEGDHHRHPFQRARAAWPPGRVRGQGRAPRRPAAGRAGRGRGCGGRGRRRRHRAHLRHRAGRRRDRGARRLRPAPGRGRADEPRPRGRGGGRRRLGAAPAVGARRAAAGGTPLRRAQRRAGGAGPAAPGDPWRRRGRTRRPHPGRRAGRACRAGSRAARRTRQAAGRRLAGGCGDRRDHRARGCAAVQRRARRGVHP